MVWSVGPWTSWQQCYYHIFLEHIHTLFQIPDVLFYGFKGFVFLVYWNYLRHTFQCFGYRGLLFVCFPFSFLLFCCFIAICVFLLVLSMFICPFIHFHFYFYHCLLWTHSLYWCYCVISWRQHHFHFHLSTCFITLSFQAFTSFHRTDSVTVHWILSGKNCLEIKLVLLLF